MEQKSEATAKGGPIWAPRGPTMSQVVPNDRSGVPQVTTKKPEFNWSSNMGATAISVKQHRIA